MYKIDKYLVKFFMHQAVDNPKRRVQQFTIRGNVLKLKLMCLLYTILSYLSTPFLNIFLFFEDFFIISFIFLQKRRHFCKNLTPSFIFDVFLCTIMHYLCIYAYLFLGAKFCAK